MVEYPHHFIEQTKTSALKSHYTIKGDEKSFSFEIEEKYLSWARLEREFSIRVEASYINVGMTFPPGTGHYQRWFGRPTLVGDIIQDKASIGHSKVDRSSLNFALEICNHAGAVIWKCRPLLPRKPGTSIVIVDSKDEEHGRVFGQHDEMVTLTSVFTKRWYSGFISEALANRASTSDTDFIFFLVAFTVSDRLISPDLHSPS